MAVDEEQPLLLSLQPDDESLNVASNTKSCSDEICAKAFFDDDPVNWPQAFKWTIVNLLSFMGFTVTFTCLSIMPSANHIIRNLNNGEPNKGASVLLVTIWELGEAAGPLFIAPLSEMFGRRVVLVAANALFVFATVLTALCNEVPMLIAARALTGLAVASNVLNPAIIGDILVPEQRGSAMTIMVAAPMIGSAVGPAVGGAVADTLGWRQVVWISVSLAVVCQVLLFACFRETYRATPTTQQASTPPASRWEQGKLSLRSFCQCVLRPARILCSSRVLAMLCVCHSLDFVFYYIMAVTLPDILEDVYGQSLSMTGMYFMYFTVGSAFSIVVCNATIDRLYTKLRDGNDGIGKPEFRLPLAIAGAVGVPVAVLLYGWAAHACLPLPYLLFALMMLGMSTTFSSMSVYTYVVDAFGIYSASAMAGVIVTRCIAGAFVPLFLAPLLSRLGYGWGFTAFSLASVALAPIPILVMRRGDRWRQLSIYTKHH